MRSCPAWWPGWPRPGRVRRGPSWHTSEANGIAVLAPLTEQGCIPLAIHPAMTFTGADEDVARLAEACFGITAADEIGYAIAQSLVLEIGGEPLPGPRGSPDPLYHAALAHGSNHLVTLVADSVAALRTALAGHGLLGQELVDDAPGGLAERILGPCASRAGEHPATWSGRPDRTGGRGDSAAVAGTPRRPCRCRSPWRRPIAPTRCGPRSGHTPEEVRPRCWPTSYRADRDHELKATQFSAGRLNVYPTPHGWQKSLARCAIPVAG